MKKQPNLPPEVNRKVQAAFRARKKALGLDELRGVFLPKELHKAVKDYAKTLVSQSLPPR